MAGGRVDGDWDPAHGQGRGARRVGGPAGPAGQGAQLGAEAARREVEQLTEAPGAQAIELALLGEKSAGPERSAAGAGPRGDQGTDPRADRRCGGRRCAAPVGYVAAGRLRRPGASLAAPPRRVRHAGGPIPGRGGVARAAARGDRSDPGTRRGMGTDRSRFPQAGPPGLVSGSGVGVAVHGAARSGCSRPRAAQTARTRPGASTRLAGLAAQQDLVGGPDTLRCRPAGRVRDRRRRQPPLDRRSGFRRGDLHPGAGPVRQRPRRPGAPTDQAWIESLLGHVKGEWPHLETITDHATLTAELDRVRRDYNQTRLHAPIGYVTPDDEYHRRGDAIRQARTDGLARAHQQRIDYHRTNHNHKPHNPTQVG